MDIIYYTREEIERARELDLLTYLRLYEPENLVHVGANVYSTFSFSGSNKKPGRLLLPEKSESVREITEYLSKRGIARNIIEILIEDGLLYESLPQHSCIFVGKDGNGTPRYAAYRACSDERILGENDEGKMNGMPLNRAITGEDGQLMDIIAGPFFIAYAPVESEKFLSMPKELEEKYTEKFRQPEQFFRTPAGIKAVKYEPEVVKENELEQR